MTWDPSDLYAIVAFLGTMTLFETDMAILVIGSRTFPRLWTRSTSAKLRFSVWGKCLYLRCWSGDLHISFIFERRFLVPFTFK